MFKVILLMLFLFFIAWRIMKSCNKGYEERIRDLERCGSKHKSGIIVNNYVGGFKDIGICRHTYLDLMEDRIIVTFKDDSKGIKEKKQIKYSDVLDVSIQTETQIKEKVSLGKILVFGVLSFGMKGNQSTISQEYLVMKVKYNNEDLDLIFSVGNAYQAVKNINEYKRVA